MTGAAPSRVLVTGATGFLGSHLARHLVARGHEVRVLARSTSDLSRLADLDVQVLPGDVTDAGSVAAAVAGVDVVYHTAALVELGADPTRMRQVNVGGTDNVLGAAAGAGALAVHVSSVAALGCTGPAIVDEAWWNPAPPAVGYELTKREAHQVAQGYAAAGARVRIGIPGGIYGTDDTSSMGKLIEALVRYPMPFGYMPELHQSLVQVDDCAAGLALIAERGEDGQGYLLCADAVTFRQWFQCIAAGAGKRPPAAYVPTRAVRACARPAAKVTGWLGGDPALVIDTVELATRHQAFSGDRARRELGWEPRGLAQGMAEVAAAVRAAHQGRRRPSARRGAGRTPPPVVTP